VKDCNTYTGIRLEPRFYRTEDSKGNPIDRSDVNKLISDNATYDAVYKANLKQIALDVQNIANTAKANRQLVTKDLLRSELDKIHKHKVESIELAQPALYFISFYEKLIVDSKNGSIIGIEKVIFLSQCHYEKIDIIDMPEIEAKFVKIWPLTDDDETFPWDVIVEDKEIDYIFENMTAPHLITKMP